MSYVSIMTAFEFGNPVLLFVLVKTHDAPIHGESKSSCLAKLTGDPFAKRRVARRLMRQSVRPGFTTYGHAQLASQPVCVPRPA